MVTGALEIGLCQTVVALVLANIDEIVFSRATGRVLMCLEANKGKECRCTKGGRFFVVIVVLLLLF